jgi:hypothetical protein
MPPMLRQCATTAITAVHATSTMFAMAAMLGRLAAQLKMPRLDAYRTGTERAPNGHRTGTSETFWRQQSQTGQPLWS